MADICSSAIVQVLCGQSCGTAGAVQYSDGSGGFDCSEDRFTYTEGGTLGILKVGVSGDSSNGGFFQVHGGTAAGGTYEIDMINSGSFMNFFGTPNTFLHGIELFRGRGSRSSPQNVQAGDELGEIRWLAYFSGNFPQFHIENVFRGPGNRDSVLNISRSTGATSWADMMVFESPSGNIGVGTSTPTTMFDMDSTTSAPRVPRMTTTQRNALTALSGMIIFNTTTSNFEGYDGVGWNAL